MVCLAKLPNHDDPRWCLKDMIDDAIASGDERMLRCIYDQLGHERAKLRRLLPGWDGDLPTLDSEQPPKWILVELCVLVPLAVLCFTVAVIEAFVN